MNFGTLFGVMGSDSKEGSAIIRSLDALDELLPRLKIFYRKICFYATLEKFEKDYHHEASLKIPNTIQLNLSKLDEKISTYLLMQI